MSVFFDKNIEDVSAVNPIVITLSNFDAGGISNFCILQLKQIAVEGLAISPPPQFITVNATAGSSNVNVTAAAQTSICHMRLKYHDDITYYYEASQVNGEQIGVIRLPAATTTITLTLKDQGGTAIVVPTTFQNIYWAARIVGY